MRLRTSRGSCNSVSVPHEVVYQGTVPHYRLQPNDGCEQTAGALRAQAYTRVLIRELVAEDTPDTPAAADEQGGESPSRSPPASTPPPSSPENPRPPVPDNTPANAPSPPSARPHRGPLTLLNPAGNLPIGGTNLLRPASYCNPLVSVNSLSFSPS